MKVLICDYVGISEQWLENFTVRKNFEVVGTILPATTQNQRALLAEDSWDYLLIFEQNSRQFFSLLIQFMNIPAERVIFALDELSWMTHPLAVYALINPEGGGQGIYRLASFQITRQAGYFVTCTTYDGLHYVATSNDITIMRNMYVNRRNWAERDIKLFHELTKKFCKVDDNDGLFLDLGANIGTTGIYFIKKLAPKLKLLAFEPDAENFKLLRANLILNELEKISTAENFGLGVEESTQTMYKNIFNLGGNSVLAHQEGAESETIKIISLDKYFAEKNLRAEEVKYIWIDTEGFESQVLLGAKNILRRSAAPIFMECNPHLWQKSGFYEGMMELLLEIYSGCVLMWEVTATQKINLYPIEKIWEFQNATTQLGDIFLVKK